MATKDMGLFASVLLFAVFDVAVGWPFRNQSRSLRPPTKPKPGDKNGDWKSELVNLKSDMKFSVVQSKSGVIGQSYRWRNGFYAQIDPRFTTAEYSTINNALYEISTHLCIPVLLWYQNVVPTGNYVFINKGEAGSGCWSMVGRQGGRQIINLQTPGCNSVGTMMHEAIHRKNKE